MIKGDSIVVVVLNYMTPDLTIRNVDLLQSKNNGIHIVVVDNLSADDSFLILSKYYQKNRFVDVISSGSNGGYSKGNNFGIKFAINKYSYVEYIAIMNPDVRCEEENLMIKLAHAIESDKKLAVVAPLMIQDNHIVPYKIGWKCDTVFRVWQKRCYWANALLANKCNYNMFRKSANNVLYCEVVQGSLFLAKRTAFQEVGFFDESVFLYYEENILGSKLKRAGYFEGTLLSSSYVHEHKLEKLDITKERNLRKKEYASANYYCKQYLKTNFLVRFFLKMSEIINLYVELPLVYAFKKINKN